MKKKKKLGPLSLNKTVISELNMKDVKGGAFTLIVCTITIYSAIRCTRGADCDLHTIGHDDGPGCISTDPDAWCGGRK